MAGQHCHDRVTAHESPSAARRPDRRLHPHRRRWFRERRRYPACLVWPLHRTLSVTSVRFRTVMAYAAWLLVSGCSAGDSSTSRTGSSPETTAALLARLSAAELLWTTNASGTCSSYYYSRYFETFTGFAAIVDVSVADNRPIARRLWTANRSDLATSTPLPAWTEGPNDVGSHSAKTSLGVELSASTVQDLFAECRHILSFDPTRYTLALDVDERGIPIRCTAWTVGCVDDCEAGIKLTGTPAVVCEPLDYCANGACPPTGLGRYWSCDPARCPNQPACGPLPDGTSCGAGTCKQGVCQ